MKKAIMWAGVALGVFTLALVGCGMLVCGGMLAGCGGGDRASQKTETPAPAAAKSPTAAAYPIDWCVVSGEQLGSMGDPVTKTYNGRTVKFCCPDCVKSFEATPARYIARLDSAATGLIKQPGEAPAEQEGHDHSGHTH